LAKLTSVDNHLNMGVDDKLGESQNFSAEVESVSESGLLSLLRRQRLDRLQVEVVVEVKVVQVLAVDQQVEHVVPLTADLKSDLDPVKTGGLEKLGCLERSEKDVNAYSRTTH
jgi:hypothetical protein